MMMQLPSQKTKIVCTIGPSSSSPEVITELLRQGMNVARLNFAHGDFANHRRTIHAIRKAAAGLNRPCMILGDLPGAKIRVGKLHTEPLMLEKGEHVLLTTDPAAGAEAIPVLYDKFTDSVTPGGIIYLNDGFIQLQVQDVSGAAARCTVLIGGELLSHKGLNLPGARLYVDPVTETDLTFVDFALHEGLDALGVSFAEKAADILKVREFAAARGSDVYVVAKIERAEALENIDGILAAADAVMIARGDLGVQIPLEDVPAAQKKLIHRANLMGRPVITATQVLVSMTANIRPTRAEVSDVANAILDGTDAVMLSEETAIGRYPAETVSMLAKIAAATEREQKAIKSLADLPGYFRTGGGRENIAVEDVLALNILDTVRALNIRYVLSPTQSGHAPRRISRFKPDCWIIALCGTEKERNFLALSYGVSPVLMEHEAGPGQEAAIQFISDAGLCRNDAKVVLTEMTSSEQPDAIDSLKVITLRCAD